MKRTVTPFLFSLLIGCAGVQTISPPTDPLERLKYDIDLILADSIFIPARTSIKVSSLESGEVMYERDSKMLMRPASNMKLLTSAAALQILGKDFQFRTSVFVDSTVIDAVLYGNIYLKGFGNPDLTTADLDTLANRIKQMGIAGITGDVIGDVSYFDDEYWGNGWMWDDEPYADEMFISPLSVNDNCVLVKVEPGYFAGDSTKVTVEPATNHVLLVNFAKTVADTVMQPLKITRLFKERANIIVVDGQILAGSTPREEQLSVWKPELYATELFKESLQKTGIRVRGKPKIGAVEPLAREAAFHVQPMDSMVVNLNKSSDNLAAENTLKTIAAVTRGIPGKSQNGVYEVNEFLASFGIDTTSFLMVDGSGVSHYNLLTTEMIVQLLAGMYQRYDLFSLFFDSLPIAGVDGTLRGRMKATSAEGNLRAKTGTISGVSSLSGYVRTRDGEMFAFSMMMQNFIGSSRYYRQAQDEIGILLARFSRHRLYAPSTP
ncbi:MAG: D-alanyl-D-alanine carboxypeptidase/D-alanyl-D-alanine-endopeptidase [Ignavibacteriales bacterium]|nr:D-alanyl-D-alanine carboxypeptidase/D-alanyl-D-alanine-endopeptidase [Ignavibacteriales bacterium]